MAVEVGDAPKEEAAITLARASRELRKAIGVVESLEQIVGLAVAQAGSAGADQMLEWQKLDHLRQKILGVADFLEALSRSMPSEWRVDALGASRCVRLGELGAKLGDAEASNAAPIGDAGETCELF
jgi:hypothetical protein